ncbi:MAG: hypothetical protein ACOYI5_04070 [Christensenellales bacterium]
MELSKHKNIKGLKKTVSKKYIAHLVNSIESHFNKAFDDTMRIRTSISVAVNESDRYYFSALNDFIEKFSPDMACNSYQASVIALKGNDLVFSLMINHLQLSGSIFSSGFDNVIVQENMNRLSDIVNDIIAQGDSITYDKEKTENVVLYAASSSERNYRRKENEEQQKNEEKRQKKSIIWNIVAAVITAILGFVAGVITQKFFN